MIGAPPQEGVQNRTTNGDDTTTSISQWASNRINTIVQYMGSPQKLFFCGGLGLGLAGKLTNNYLSCTILLANAEAMAFGTKLGVDKHLLYKIVQNSSGQNWMMEHVCPAPGVVPHAPSSNGYKLGFKTQMLQKDVGLAADAARTVGIHPAIGDAAIGVYVEAGNDERYKVSYETSVNSHSSLLLTCVAIIGRGWFDCIQIHRWPRLSMLCTEARLIEIATKRILYFLILVFLLSLTVRSSSFMERQESTIPSQTVVGVCYSYTILLGKDMIALAEQYRNKLLVRSGLRACCGWKSEVSINSLDPTEI